MIPSEHGSPETLAPPLAVTPRPDYRWYHKLWAVLLVTFCLEIGCFLLFFPWSGYWDTNYFAHALPQLQSYWSNTYFRGLVSGLGVANLYISLAEIFRLRRFVRHR